MLGLATGSTPVGTYAQLVEWYKKGDLDFSEVKTVNLDEYKGLDQSNDQSYFYFMAEHLFDKVNICLLYTSTVLSPWERRAPEPWSLPQMNTACFMRRADGQRFLSTQAISCLLYTSVPRAGMDGSFFDV